jgi:transposase
LRRHISGYQGKQIVFISRWYPSSKTCSCCGHQLEKLDLSTREWRCPSCGSINDRDENAAINIKMIGASTIGVGDVRQARACYRCLSPESPWLQPGEYVNSNFAPLATTAVKNLFFRQIHRI